jgi:hypothetical protein
MKKYLLGIIAVVLAVGFSAFTAIKPIKKTKDPETLYWYAVENGFTSGGYIAHAQKPTVILNQGCKDTPLHDICLVGSEDNDLDGVSVTGFDSDHRILKGN